MAAERCWGRCAMGRRLMVLGVLGALGILKGLGVLG
jgi:hypothetical protein